MLVMQIDFYSENGTVAHIYSSSGSTLEDWNEEEAIQGYGVYVNGGGKFSFDQTMDDYYINCDKCGKGMTRTEEEPVEELDGRYCYDCSQEIEELLKDEDRKCFSLRGHEYAWSFKELIESSEAMGFSADEEIFYEWDHAYDYDPEEDEYAGMARCPICGRIVSENALSECDHGK